MSAWDITGAVVWGALAAFCWWAGFGSGERDSLTDKVVFGYILVGGASTAATIFCIARLFGAHL